MQLIIRPLQPEDYREIGRLIRDTLGYHDTSEEGVAERLDRMNSHPDYETFVAESDGEVAGFIGVCRGIAYEFDQPYLKVTALAVDALCQGMGVGSQLLRYVHQFARETGCGMVLLNSGFHREAAHRFYEKRGYEKKGYSFRKPIEEE